MPSRHLSLRLLLTLAALASAPACKTAGPDDVGGNNPQAGGNTPTGGQNNGLGEGGVPGATDGNTGVTPPTPAGPSEPVPTPVCTTGTPADVTVTVTSKAGPNGFAAPIPLTQNLYSQGIDDRSRGDYFPTLKPDFVALLKGLKPAYIRFPAGHNGQQYTWSTTAPDDFGVMTPKLLDAYVALCRAVGAEPYMAVNINSGSIADAVNTITYANKTKNYGIKWWQIGNEPNLGSQTGSLTPGFTNYPATYLKFRQALLDVDPTIKLVGLESYQGMAILREFDSRGNFIDRGEADFFSPFLAAVGDKVDAVAWHYYSLYSGEDQANPYTDVTRPNSSSAISTKNLFQESASDWPPAGMGFADMIIPYMRSKMKASMPNAQIWIDEFAEDSGNALAGRGVSDTMAGALWGADITGRYADQGTDGIFHFIFKANGHPGLQFGYTLIGTDDVPRPEYYAEWLMANHYGNQMVRTSTTAKTVVNSHAALRSSDNSLRVMLVNKSGKAQKVRLQLGDFAPVRASQYVLSAPALSSKTATINGKALTAANAALGDAAIPAAVAQACADNTFEVPAYSVSMVVFTSK